MTALAQRTQMEEVEAHISSADFGQQIAQALPPNVTLDRFTRVTLTAIQQTPELITADRASLYNAVVRCAQDGLYPDSREAALVMFGNKVAYMPMIFGFRKIAAEHGWTIDTQAVYERDAFDFELGSNPKLTHKPPRLGTERGAIIGAYAVCTHSDGRKQIEVMGKAEIEKVRAVSKTSRRGPWVDWYERQAEKTVGRRAFVKLPLSDRDSERVARVLAASDDEYELVGPDGEPMTVEEANLNASLMTGTVPADSGPVDTIDGDAVDVTDGDAGPVDDGPTEEDIEAAQRAAGYPVKWSDDTFWAHGMTLAQVNADERGVEFFQWALSDANKGRNLKAAAAAYAKVQLPFLYAATVGGAS